MRVLRYRCGLTVGTFLLIIVITVIVNAAWRNVPLWVFAADGALLALAERFWAPRKTGSKS